MITIQNQNFGVEIELTGITRQAAAQVIADYYGTIGTRFMGTAYKTYEAVDNKGRRWKCMRDASITPQRRVNGHVVDTLTTKDRHGVLCEGRIRRLTPRECLRLQGWTDDRIDTMLAIQSDNQAYKQAGNGVTVNVIEAIGRRIAAMDAELRGEAFAP